jgi:Tol biopolymer transport system component
LNSWKEIAAYLDREIRTIQRWEKEEGLPVHRLRHTKRGSVYAFRRELDAWWLARSALLAQPAAADSSHDEVETTVRPKMVWVWLVAAIAVAAVGAIWFTFGRRKVEPSSSAAVPLTSYPGRELSPAFSPDGNQIVFAWNGPNRDNFDIYVKGIGSYSPQRLSTDSRNEYSPAWSPDGALIAFLRDLGGGRAAVILKPSRGGPETEIAETSATPRPSVGVAEIPLSSLAWSADGKWLAISDRNSATEPFAIFAVSIETGQRRKLTSPVTPSAGDFSPAFSPNGSRIAFFRATVLLVSEIYVLSLSPGLDAIGEPLRITNNGRWSISPTWTPGGDEIVYSSGDYWIQQLFRIRASGGSMPQRLISVENGSTPVVSPRTHRLAYVRTAVDCDICSLPTAPRGNTMAQPVSVISSTETEVNMDYSPDGSRIVFTSDRSGYNEIWISEKDGSHPAQWTFFGKRQTGTPRWSPDGKQIVFDSRSDGSGEIWVMSVEPKSPPRRLTTNPASDLVPSWSRNGQWIYFASNRSGEFQVWRMPSQGGRAEQVTHHGGGYGLESADGSTLYYSKTLSWTGTSGTSVWRIPIIGGDETEVLAGVQQWSNFKVTAKGIYFTPVPVTGAPPMFAFYDFAGRNIRTVARLAKPICMGLAISPNGESFLYSQLEQWGGDLMLVENFR